MFHDRRGNPIALSKWLRLLEDEGYRRVARDTVGGIQISTIWNGIHPGHGDGPPAIFETATRFGRKPWHIQQRYSTEEEALAGHALFVRYYNDEDVEKPV